MSEESSEEEIINLSSWTVGVSKNGKVWSTFLSLIGTSNIGACKYQINITSLEIAPNSLILEGFPRGNYEPDKLTLLIVENQMHVKMSNPDTFDFTMKYQFDNPEEPKIVLDMLEKTNCQVQILSAK